MSKLMKKSVIIVLGIAVILLVTYCFRQQPEKYFLPADSEIGIDSDMVSSKQMEYITHLEENVEKDFSGEDDIKSADAEISYNESKNQYAITLSLITEKEMNAEDIETYKNVLKNTYIDVILIVNGTEQ